MYNQPDKSMPAASEGQPWNTRKLAGCLLAAVSVLIVLIPLFEWINFDFNVEIRSLRVHWLDQTPWIDSSFSFASNARLLDLKVSPAPPAGMPWPN